MYILMQKSLKTINFVTLRNYILISMLYIFDYSAIVYLKFSWIPQQNTLNYINQKIFKDHIWLTIYTIWFLLAILVSRQKLLITSTTLI